MFPDDFTITRLSKEDINSLVIFNCYNENEYQSITPRVKKKLKRITEEMNVFLQQEALEDQDDGYNTTFLLYNKMVLVGYLSLCADGIKLDLKERDDASIPYEMVPALKIARLAVDRKFHKLGIGKAFINYAVYKSLMMREEISGVKFITLDCFPHRESYYTNIGFVMNKVQSNSNKGKKPISMRLHIDNYLDKQRVQ
jgi:GNAT superfamily N-acetyltransferase